MGIAMEIARIAVEEAERHNARRVSVLALAVGRWSGVEPETLRFVLGIVCEDSILKGCEVKVEVIEPTFDCIDCGEKFIAEGRFDPCPKCGGAGGPLVAGDELNISHLEVED